MDKMTKNTKKIKSGKPDKREQTVKRGKANETANVPKGANISKVIENREFLYNIQDHELLGSPGTANHLCADCKNQGPSRACLDKGVFLCTGCQQMHLSHNISKVIINLKEKRLSPEQRGIMMSMGNAKAAEHWEAEMTTDDEEERRVTSQFIPTKYKEKRWVSHEKEAAETLIQVAGEHVPQFAATVPLIFGSFDEPMEPRKN